MGVASFAQRIPVASTRTTCHHLMQTSHDLRSLVTHIGGGRETSEVMTREVSQLMEKKGINVSERKVANTYAFQMGKADHDVTAEVLQL
ncbi:hypothetical protein PsorP6_009411 [Peronosclerospora sorghi]|uniref:Uncharacterized protein n=1 Tax=Peronosclerospora sorghi TaxID=230839 RepID=A0ACC0VZQ4_9STRA|nr:hypothetical protein PsorP6_009411 [Peronosclerospora sorghi]